MLLRRLQLYGILGVFEYASSEAEFLLAGGGMSVARPSEPTRRSPSPFESACLIGFISFVLSLLIPATYVARHRRDVVAPPDAQLIEYVRRNWTEESGFTKAIGIGLVSGIAAIASEYVARAIRRREPGRGG